MEAGGALGVFDQQDCMCGVLAGGGKGGGGDWGAGWRGMEACQRVQSAGERGLLTWNHLTPTLQSSNGPWASVCRAVLSWTLLCLFRKIQVA